MSFSKYDDLETSKHIDAFYEAIFLWCVCTYIDVITPPFEIEQYKYCSANVSTINCFSYAIVLRIDC